ncbi:Transposase_IS4 [Hexamita inflata]|uniref:Transposase_IS4 n=1 Tax=Hexamita inflata TaxID=28002 RepID=A0ABP1HNT7_9EUKA
MKNFKGVDTQDERLSFIQWKLRVKRWPKRVLFQLQGMIINNALALWNLNNPKRKLSTKDFTMNVAVQLKNKWFPILLRTKYQAPDHNEKHEQIHIIDNPKLLNKSRQLCQKYGVVRTVLSCTCDRILCDNCYHEHILNLKNFICKE